MKNKTVNAGAYLAGSLVAVFATSALALTPPKFTDFDQDGVISEAEITQVRDSHRAEMLNEYDTDGNGELSRLERRAAKDARHAEVVQQFDADGDGELSRAERRSARDARRQLVESQFDVDQDGVLSDAEREGYDALKQSRGHGKRCDGGDRKTGHRKGGDAGADTATDEQPVN